MGCPGLDMSSYLRLSEPYKRRSVRGGKTAYGRIFRDRVVCSNDAVNKWDWLGLDTYICFDVNGFATGGREFGHVEIITHNPFENEYTVFSRNRNTVFTKSGGSWRAVLGKGIDILFIIPDVDNSDYKIDCARKNFKDHDGDNTFDNNCMTSVAQILRNSKVTYPKLSYVVPRAYHPYTTIHSVLYPNEWLDRYWELGYGYKITSKEGADWIRERFFK